MIEKSERVKLNNSEDSDENYKIKYKFLNRSVLISMGCYVLISFIDIIRNELSVQCMIVTLVFLLSEIINKLRLKKNKKTIPFIILFFALLIAMISGYIHDIVN
mgnify:CR=1 FL=1